MKLLLILFIILLNNNYIESSKVQFNNSIILNCLNNNNPCDITSRHVWMNNELPSDGDDVLIDLSSESATSSIYLIANNFHLHLNSFTINGQHGATDDDYSTTLTIQNSNLAINHNLNVSLSNVNFVEDSDYQLLLGSLNLDNGVLNVNGNAHVTFNSVLINSPKAVTVNDNSTFHVNNEAVFNSPFIHSSSGLFTLSGNSQISNSFTSTSGAVIFDETSNVEISFTSSFYNLSINTPVSVLGGPESNVTITTLQTDNSGQIILSQQSNLIIQDTINLIQILGEEILVTQNSKLYLPSGYDVYQVASNTNGTFIITDSNSVSTFDGCTSLQYMCVISSANLTISNSELDTVQMINPTTSITTKSSAYLNNVIAPQSYIIVSQYSTLSTLHSTSYETYVSGTLINYNNFTTNNIYIAKGGLVDSYSNIIGNIIDYSSTVKFERPTSITSLYIYSGGTLTMNTFAPLLVNNNLTIESNSVIQIYEPELNSQTPQFIVNGLLNIGAGVNISIIFNSTDIDIVNHDRILLFNSTNSSDNSFITPSISVKLLINDVTSKFNINILNENGLYIIEFINKDNNNNNNNNSNNSPLSKGKIAAIIIVPLIVIIALIAIIYKVKKQQSNNNNNNNHEREPLI